MAESDAQICNLALMRIGISSLIDSLDDPSTEAAMCKATYSLQRDALLAMFDWPFATKRADLAVVANAERSGWEYVYALPADCVHARRIWDGLRNPRADQRIPFEIEAGESGAKVLLTDEKEAELIYTARVTSAGSFPPLFVDALAWLLAAELAMALPKKANLEEGCRKRFQLALAGAGAAAMRESSPDVEPDSEFIAVRS